MLGQVLFERDFNFGGWEASGGYRHVRQRGSQCGWNPKGNGNLGNPAGQWTADLGFLRLFRFGCHSGLRYIHRSPFCDLLLIVVTRLYAAKSFCLGGLVSYTVSRYNDLSGRKHRMEGGENETEMDDRDYD